MLCNFFSDETEYEYSGSEEEEEERDIGEPRYRPFTLTHISMYMWV